MADLVYIVAAFLLYFVVLFLLGLYASRKSQSLRGYFFAERRLGVLVSALSAEASAMSGWLFLALPGLTYVIGLGALWVSLGIVLGAYLNWRFVAAPLRMSSEILGACSFSEYFVLRFVDKRNVLRGISAVVILCFYAVYCVAGFVGMAKLFELVFGFSYFWGLLLGGGVVLLYTCLGGYFAVCWSDVLQGLLVFLALCVVPVSLFLELWRLDASFLLENNAFLEKLNPFGDVDLLAGVSFLSWGLGYCGQPHVCLRFMSVAHVADLPKIRRIAMFWRVVVFLGALSSGMFGYAFFSVADLSLPDPEKLFLRVSVLLFHPFVAGIVLSAVLASVMSTVDSQLLISASVVSQGLMRRFVKSPLSQRQVLLWARGTVFVLLLCVLFCAYFADDSVHGLVAYAWAGPGAVFGPPMLFSLYWKTTTRLAVVCGMLVAGAFLCFWNIPQIYVLLPAFLGSSLVIWCVSLVSRKTLPLEALNRLYS